MKFTFFSSVDAFYHRPFYRWLQQRGCAILLHVWGRASNETLGLAGVRVVEQPIVRGYTYNEVGSSAGVSWRAAFAVVRAPGALVVHGWSGSYWMLLIFLAVIFRKPYLLLNDLNENALLRGAGLFAFARMAWLRFAVGRAIGVISTSDSNELLMKGILPSVRVFRLSWHAIYLKSVARDWSVRVPSDSGRVLFIGRYEPIKGFDLAVRACAELGLTLECYGRGSLQGNEASGIRVRGAYEPRDLPDIIRVGDIVVAPSRSEALGLAVLEAAWCGAIVVASDSVVAAREVFGSSLGFVFPHPTVKSIAAELQKLTSLPISERIALGFQNRESVLRWCHRKCCSSEYAFEELLSVLKGRVAVSR